MAFPETQIPSFLIAEAGTGVGMLLWAVFGHTAKEHRALFCGSQCCQRVSGTMDCLQIITRHKGKLLAFINKKFPLYQALFQKGKGRNWHYVKVLPCQNRLPLLLIWNCFICDPWSLLVACISGYCDLIPMTLPNLQTSYHISSNCSFLFYFAGCTVNYFFNGLGVCMCSPSLSLSLSLSSRDVCTLCYLLIAPCALFSFDSWDMQTLKKWSYLVAGSLCGQFFLFTIWLSSFQDVVGLLTLVEYSHVSSTTELAKPPNTDLFEPIEISPAVFPHLPSPTESFPPMYPSFPATYEPVLTGKCPVNFSAISSILNKTASDCSLPLASLVGNVICCPQFSSLLHIFQGYYSTNSDKLVLQDGMANDCFSDIISILASRGANSTIPTICSVKSSNLTGGSCPIKDVSTFEKTVNTSKLLEACSTVDPLKECCRPVCRPAIMDAAVQISVRHSVMSDNKNILGETSHVDVLNDCKGVVSSWLSRKLSSDAANTTFRILSACKVNKGMVFSFVCFLLVSLLVSIFNVIFL